jgi:cytochrome oxidase Cu insertion factor (SCO1/SenC/PrrC family)
VLGIVTLSQSPGWLVGIPAVFSIVVALFFSITFAIGGQFVGPSVIAVGATLPTFTAIDENGETFDSVNLAGNPVLIKFFRGLW